MKVVEFKLALPDDLAQEAKAKGLLEPEAVTAMIGEEVRRRRVDKLFEAADRLAAVKAPALTAAEVEAEIRAARQGRRARHASRG